MRPPMDLAAEIHRHHKNRWCAVPYDHSLEQQDHAFRWHVLYDWFLHCHRGFCMSVSLLLDTLSSASHFLHASPSLSHFRAIRRLPVLNLMLRIAFSSLWNRTSHRFAITHCSAQNCCWADSSTTVLHLVPFRVDYQHRLEIRHGCRFGCGLDAGSWLFPAFASAVPCRLPALLARMETVCWTARFLSLKRHHLDAIPIPFDHWAIYGTNSERIMKIVWVSLSIRSTWQSRLSPTACNNEGPLQRR